MRRVLFFGRYIDIGILKGLMFSFKMWWFGDDYVWFIKFLLCCGLFGNKYDRSCVCIWFNVCLIVINIDLILINGIYFMFWFIN